jgi:hypothetical protein
MKQVMMPLALAALLLLAGVALAQRGGPYDLTWNTTDGGAETISRGGSFVLGATVGQPDAGLLRGGSFTLSGGFWPGVVVTRTYHVYLPLLGRQHTPQGRWRTASHESGGGTRKTQVLLVP